jgi:hypothetical protein
MPRKEVLAETSRRLAGGIRLTAAEAADTALRIHCFGKGVENYKTRKTCLEDGKITSNLLSYLLLI